MLFINIGLSYPSVPGLLPDPFFRIWIKNIHKSKHGSDTGTYDTEGRFLPQKFEDVFAKYGTKGAEDGITFRQALTAAKGQRLAMDPFGWTAELLECGSLRRIEVPPPPSFHADSDSGFATYLFLWPADGLMRKEDVRRVYDGSLFFEVASKRANEEAEKTRKRDKVMKQI